MKKERCNDQRKIVIGILEKFAIERKKENTTEELGERGMKEEKRGNRKEN